MRDKITSNEDWKDGINAFRSDINSRINMLEKQTHSPVSRREVINSLQFRLNELELIIEDWNNGNLPKRKKTR